MSQIDSIRETLKSAVTLTPKEATRFFKTEKGAYAENDIFIGVTIPNLRQTAKVFSTTSLDDIQKLITSPINEERFLALIMLVTQFQKSVENRTKIYDFFMKNISFVNNWNLVDASAHHILGAYIFDKDRTTLLNLAQSKNLWKRRISIVSTWYFIRQNDLDWTFKLSGILLNDHHDLMHKAVGWMLREAGKKNEGALLEFLNSYTHTMPRTMLRYAIEKLSEPERKKYLSR